MSIFKNILGKLPVFSLSGKMNIQIPSFLSAVATPKKLRELFKNNLHGNSLKCTASHIRTLS